MLSYQPPFMDVGNLTIFRDDSDPETFYYGNIQPSIVQHNGVPSISAYTILPENSSGDKSDLVVDTSLSLEVSLRVSEEALEIAKKEIKEKWGKKAKRLLPVTITDGKVYLILASAGEEPDPANWFISSGVSPSIFGDNRAALVVKTSGQEAKRLVAALNEDTVAGHLYYELNMLGIAPTFNAKLRVHWDRVYKHFEDIKVRNLVFKRKEISNTFDDLAESSLVEIEIEELDPEVQNVASRTLLNELKTEAVKRLFKPAVPPLSASEKIENRIANAVGMVHASIIPGSHYILRNNHEIQTSEFTVDLKERKAKKYPFYPQALLSTMIQRAGGLQDNLKWIKLDNLPFRVETITADIAADTFKVNNIQTIRLVCEVWDETSGAIEKSHTFIFDKTKSQKGTFTYTRQRSNVYKYRYKTTIFLDNEGTGLPNQMEVDWIETPSEFIYFNPTEYFENIQLQLGIDDTDIFKYTHLIEVEVTAVERETDKKLLTKSFILKEDQENIDQQVLSLIYSNLHPVRLDLKVIYYIKDAEEFIEESPDHQDLNYFIPNPFENKWSVDLMSVADWEKTLKFITEIRIWDAARKTWIEKKFDFSSEKTSEKQQVVTSLETPRETLEYRTTVVSLSGDITRGAWKRHQGPILVLRDEIKPERSLKAKLIEAPDFDEFEIKEVALTIIYEDPENDVLVNSDDSEKLNFNNVGDEVSFVHEMPDSTKREYKYRYKARKKSGESFKSDWIKTDREFIEIRLPENIW